MSSTSRAQPPEDSPAPGIIPGTVHVHNEPSREPHGRALKQPPTVPPRAPKSRFRAWVGRHHRP